MSQSQPPQPPQSPAPTPQATQPPPGGNIPLELNSLISDEVLRARVLQIIQAPQPQSRIKRIRDHWVTEKVFTFALTGLVGLWLTSCWEQSRLEATRKIEQERRETDARIAAFTDFL